jgi:hypothetical protein
MVIFMREYAIILINTGKYFCKPFKGLKKSKKSVSLWALTNEYHIFASTDFLYCINTE